ncbi:hypothetical protein [Pseudomonas fluorescens]|uniref:Uncharacterized protein n=1 Tax=Pseudomonas fluorescens TaxID=294 RepID=A0A5E7N1H5_PSEFL|nr:hypothetical protein [Pseudomonas fluorescens]VVP30956.1 hypothetical protein PS880_04336 [Pseudomonas fluorescens]
MTYPDTLAAYQALLADKPGQALLIGQGMAYRLQEGHLVGVYLDKSGQVENGSEFDFDVSAFDPSRGCWDCDDSTAAMMESITTPKFVSCSAE